MSHSLTRRRFLEHTALAGLLAPVAGYWKDTAFAQAAGKRRLVLVFVPNGKHRNSRFVVPTANGFSFVDAYAGLEAFKSDIIAFHRHGYQAIISGTPFNGQADGHNPQGKTIFSGFPPTGGRPGSVLGPQGPTIDQLVATEFVRRGQFADATKVTLAARIQSGGWFDEHVFYGAPGYAPNRSYAGQAMTPISMLNAPRTAFDRYFGALASMQSAPSTASLWSRGKSILDGPSAELASLRATLPADGKAVLDRHLASLRGLETSLEAKAATDAPVATGPIPPRPSEIAVSPANYRTLIDNWHKLIAAVFRSDLARVAVLQYGGTSARFQIPELNLGFVGTQGDSNSGTDHHSHTHWSGTVENEKFQQWYTARFCELLAEFRGGEGRANLLDDSLIAWGMEHGDAGGHQANDVPFLFAGRAGGFFTTGRMLDNANNGRAHNAALLSAIHAMGMTDITSFGAPNFAPDATYSVARMRS